MTSLRRTMIASLTFILAIVGALSAAASYEFALAEAGEFMDDQLRQVASLTDGQLYSDGAASTLSEPEDHWAILLWAKDGTPLHATSGAPKGMALPRTPGFSFFEKDGESWRAFVSHQADRTLMVAQLMSARDELAQHAALEAAIPILAVVPLAWVVVLFTVGRVLRRLSGLGARIAERSIDAREPLPVEGLPLEIRPLVDAMNIQIERLQAALRQQRDFIADSAHELRTPLAALRLQIDNLVGETTPVAADAAQALQDGIARASAVLNQLLKLARFDGADERGEKQDLDLRELVTQCVADAVELADDAQIDLGITRIESARIRGVQADIQLLVSNILDNAIRYTPRGGSVDCEVFWEKEQAVLRFCDTGPGVAEMDIPRLTDRFFRAAAPDKPGSGLGLSIVKAISDLHDLEFSVMNRTDRSGLAVEFRFPPFSPSHHLR